MWQKDTEKKKVVYKALCAKYWQLYSLKRSFLPSLGRLHMHMFYFSFMRCSPAFMSLLCISWLQGKYLPVVQKLELSKETVLRKIIFLLNQQRESKEKLESSPLISKCEIQKKLAKYLTALKLPTNFPPSKLQRFTQPLREKKHN